MNSNNVFVAVTTAPREESHLLSCLESINAAGWKPHVFAEPGSTPSNDYDTLTWESRQGLWRNWLAAVDFGLKSEAEYILTVQDDCLMHPDTKALVDCIPEPRRMGYLSLYTPSHYQEDQNGNPIRGIYTVEVASMWGALALLFHRDTLKQIVTDQRAIHWLGIKPKGASINWREEQKAHPERIKNSDYIIGSIVSYSLAKLLYYVSPSPCYHSASISSVGHSGNTGKRNAKYIANFQQPLIPQIFENEMSVSEIGDLRISNTNRKDSVYYYPKNM